jgi:RNA polymerase sigma factor (sigma-70 family)
MPNAEALSPEQTELLARWYPVVRTRCRLSVWDGAADDVAQNVMERLLRELRRGKTYAVPYRVVVHNVVRWKIKEHFEGRSYEAELDEALAGGDPFEELEGEDLVRSFVARLPERQREVAELRLLERLEIPEIAARLGIERNAVDQAWHNAKAKLRALLDG